MKNLRPFLSYFILLFTATTTTAQIDVEHIYSKNKTTFIRSHIQIGDDVYAVGAFGTCKTPILSKFTNDETTIVNGTSGYWEYDDIGYIENPTGRSIFVSGGYYLIDDVPSEVDGPRITGYQYEIQNFETTFPPMPVDLNDFYSKVSALTIDGAENVVSVFNDNVYRVNSSGDILGNVHYPSADFITIETLNATTTLALGKHILYWLDLETMATDSLEIASQALDLWVQDGRILVLTQEALLEVVNGSSYTAYNDFYDELTVKGITGNSSHLFIWGKDQQSEFSEILQLDATDFELLDQTLFDKPSTSIKELTASEETLVLNGNYSLNFGYRTDFIKSMDIGSSPVFREDDIRLVDFETDSEWTYTTEEYEIAPNQIITLYTYTLSPFEYTFEVTNVGPDTLRSFSLYGQWLGGFNCYQLREFTHYKDLAIPPGASQTFSETFNITLPAEESSVPPILEFSVFAPNHHFDANPDDNLIVVDVAVPVKETGPLAKLIQLSPNPSDRAFRLIVEEQEKRGAISTSIYDTYGRQIKSEQRAEFFGRHEETISTVDFAAGIYLLKIELNGLVSTQKIIVSH